MKEITEADRQARAERYKKIGEANKGRKRPDVAASKGKSNRAAKAKTDEKKVFMSEKPVYTNPILLAYRLARYMTNQDKIEWKNSSGQHKGQPYTIAGGRLASGLDSGGTWKVYLEGERDHLTTMQDTVEPRHGWKKFLIHNVEKEYLPYTLYLLGDPDGYLTDPETVDLDCVQDWAKEVFFSVILGKYVATVESQREQDLYSKGRTSDIFCLKQYGWTDDTVIVNRREMTNSVEAREMLEEFFKLPQLED